MESLELPGSSTVYVGNLSSLFQKYMGKRCIYVYTFVYINISLLLNTVGVTVARMLISKPRAVSAENVISGYKCSL